MEERPFKVARRVEISYILEIKKIYICFYKNRWKREYVTSINFLFLHKMSFNPDKI